MNKKEFSITTSIVNALIWGCAVFFACKWFVDMFNFRSLSDAVFIIIVSAFAIAGAVISFLYALLSCEDIISVKVQISVLLMGMLTLWSMCGN